MISSVFIVDDHPFVCSGIKAYLRANGYIIAGVAEDGTSVIADVGLHRPDVGIMDLNIPGRDGMQVIESLKRINAQQKIIVLTASDSDFHMHRCQLLGVDGYLCKSHDTSQLLQAIRSIDKGVKFYPNTHSLEAKAIHPESEKLMSLSRRELMVLRKLAAGYSNKEIALQLSLSNKTISTYKIKILRKLGIKSVVDINEIAKRNYLV